MITWISKGPLAALLLGLALAGCEPGAGGSGSAALPSARLSAGDVALVAPQGYCIDRRALRAAFALLGRCDALGQPEATASLGRPLGAITVSLTPFDPEAPLPSAAENAAALELSAVSSATERSDYLLFRATGPVPTEGFAAQHWRAVTRVRGHLVGLAFYAPAEAGGVGPEERAVLRDLIALIQKANPPASG